MAQRHGEFLELGGRVFALSADPVIQNTAVVEKLALPFPILSDPDRDRAITPLGFADEDDPRQISKPGTVIIAPGGEVVFSVTGRDYADRPDEETLLARLGDLRLPATTQAAPELGAAQPGDTAMAYEGLSFYFRGAKFAGLALRGRHRDLGEDFRGDTKGYVRMVERYMEALPYVEQRRA